MWKPITVSSLLSLIIAWSLPQESRLDAFVVGALDNTVLTEQTPPKTEFRAQQPTRHVAPLYENRGSAAHPTQDLQSYHLMWSKGAKSKALVSLATFLAGHAAFRYVGLDKAVQGIQVPTVVADIFVPLFASSCCLLQLALNLLSVGCVGFNTVLGPSRPYFVGLLMYLSVLSTDPFSTRFLKRFLLRWSIALLPEATHLWNWQTGRRSSRRVEAKEHEATPHMEATITINIPTMGCVACINTIDSALRNIPHVTFASSSLNPLGSKGGQAQVRVMAKDASDLALIENSLVDAVESSGFVGSSIISTKLKE